MCIRDRPAAELVMDKGYDVLLLTEDVDEFCLQIMRTYPRKDAEGKDGTVEFKNVNKMCIRDRCWPQRPGERGGRASAQKQ